MTKILENRKVTAYALFLLVCATIVCTVNGGHPHSGEYLNDEHREW